MNACVCGAGHKVGRANEARGRALPSSEGTVRGFTSDWLRGDKTGAELCSRVHHGARRASWDCWSPSILASLTPSTSWTPPSRVGPQPYAPESPLILVLSVGLMALSPISLPAAAILQKVGRPNLQLQMVSGRKGMLLRRPVFPTSGENGVGVREPARSPTSILYPGPVPLADHGWEPDRKHTGVPAPRW